MEILLRIFLKILILLAGSVIIALTRNIIGVEVEGELWARILYTVLQMSWGGVILEFIIRR